MSSSSTGVALGTVVVDVPNGSKGDVPLSKEGEDGDEMASEVTVRRAG